MKVNKFITKESKLPVHHQFLTENLQSCLAMVSTKYFSVKDFEPCGEAVNMKT